MTWELNFCYKRYEKTKGGWANRYEKTRVSVKKKQEWVDGN